MKNLSETAQKLYTIVKGTSLFEGKVTAALFNKPEYPTDGNVDGIINFWQWDANMFGNKRSVKVNGEFITFEKNIPVCYDRLMWAAYFELKAAGLVRAKNNGTNEYYIIGK